LIYLQSSNCNKKFNINKIQFVAETRVDDLCYVIGFKLKKYHFCEEISYLEQGATTSQNILKYHILWFLFLLTSHLHEEKHSQEYKFNWMLFIIQHEKSTRKIRMKNAFTFFPTHWIVILALQNSVGGLVIPVAALLG